MARANDGKFETTYTKVVGITGGMGFSGGGPLPRALLLARSSVAVTFKDIHGNEVTIGTQDNLDVTRMIEGLEVSDIVSVSGAQGAYVLW